MKKFIYIFAAFIILSNSIFSLKSQAQWVQMNSVYLGNVYCFSVLGSKIFAGTAYGVYLSTNNGNTWYASNSGLPYGALHALAVSGTNIYAGTEEGVYLSTNNGTSWIGVNNGGTQGRVLSLAVSGTNLFAGTYNQGIFLSTNNGSNWTAVNNGLTANDILSLAVSGSNIFAGTWGNGVFLSPNNGSNWTAVNNVLPSNYSVTELAVSGTNIFAGTLGGIFLSTNSGTNWIAVNNGLTGLMIYSLAIEGTNIFAGPYSYNNGWGVYLSTNNGTNWTDINQGFGFLPRVDALLISNNYIFAGAGSSIWRRPLSEVIGIQNISTETPSKYSLSQNFPNPFNPTTRIKFNIAKIGDVKIVVYDVMGRDVQTLVNETLQPGTYETTFNGSQLTSGIYFYKISIGDFSQTKKMTLIK